MIYPIIGRAEELPYFVGGMGLECWQGREKILFVKRMTLRTLDYQAIFKAFELQKIVNYNKLSVCQ